MVTEPFPIVNVSRRPVNMSDPNKLPEHVAIIMDGNGRWAKRRGMPRVFGHQQGAERVGDVVEVAGELGIKALTLYTFSEENWERPADEIQALFGLLTSYLKKETPRLVEKNVRLRMIGAVERLPEACQALLAEAAEQTASNDGLQLTLALSYGGRSEIVAACREIAQDVAAGLLDPSQITQATVAQHMGASDLPDPDLLIRTSGELRVSNFLLWQIAYTELYFTPVNWPDFGKEQFMEAIRAFQQRDRRYGRVDSEHGYQVRGDLLSAESRGMSC